MYEVSAKLYQQAAPEQQGAPTAEGSQTEQTDGNNVYDADYKDVDNN